MRSIHSLAAACVVALVLALTVVQPASADVVCTSDECDANAWKLARGEFNEESYWGMDPGHNCTNYVAWKLIVDGVERPATNPGNASTWATRAAADGYLVDHVPAVGAVAQWDAFAGGYTEDGHVAYVEEVNPDGTIVVSEDYWLGGSQSGSLTYRTLAASEVTNFIHYIDTFDWLRQDQASAGVWADTPMGLDVAPTVMTAVTIEDKLQVFLVQEGKLTVATAGPVTSAGPSDWVVTDTGITTTGHSLAAVDMGASRPYLMSVEDDELVMMVPTSSWQFMRTGIQVTGELAAVDLGGLWPTVYLSQGGELYEIWGDTEGWHVRAVGVEVWGPVSAVINAAGWPEVFTVESGMIFRSWADESGWHKESTGVTASGRVAATRVGDTVQLALLQDGQLSHVVRDATGIWSKLPTLLRGGTVFTAVGGAESPLVVQVG